MNIIALLTSFIYLVSSSLLLPMLLLLSLLTVWLVVYSGTFFSLWLARRRLPSPPDAMDSLLQQRFNGFSVSVRRF